MKEIEATKTAWRALSKIHYEYCKKNYMISINFPAYFLAAVLCLFVHTIYAEDETEIKKSSEINLQLSSIPEFRLGFTQRFKFPFLQGKSLWTEDNNITLALTAEISPVSLNGIVEAFWTPVAFFQLGTGGRIGSGWNINLFGYDFYGIGFNRADAAGNAEHSGSSFDGLLWKTQIGAALQVDLAALYPGDWNHFVVRTYHEINYSGYTRAVHGESWYYEVDSGENVNGFNYYCNMLIGYQMPIFINFVALLAQVNLPLYDTPDHERWGDNIPNWIFSCLLNFRITKQIEAALFVQLQTQKNYQEPNWEELYYRNRNIDNANPVSLKFFRAGTVLTYRIKN